MFRGTCAAARRGGVGVGLPFASSLRAHSQRCGLLRVVCIRQGLTLARERLRCEQRGQPTDKSSPNPVGLDSQREVV